MALFFCANNHITGMKQKKGGRLMTKLEFDNKRFSEIITSNNLNTKELAKSLGISETTVFNWMRGDAIPSNGYVEKINKVIGVELFYKTKSDKKTKYKNDKTVVNGIKFDSVKEAKRYSELKILEKMGEISALQMQVKYVLIPSQKDEKGKCIERECSYLADFVYKNKEGKMVVEDTKGIRTTTYIIKRKLMLYVHHIKIIEI